MFEARQVNSQVNSLHINGHEYEIVDKFSYLGDMLSQGGGYEHAILKRIQTGWLKFRELSSLMLSYTNTTLLIQMTRIFTLKTLKTYGNEQNVSSNDNMAHQRHFFPTIIKNKNNHLF